MRGSSRHAPRAVDGPLALLWLLLVIIVTSPGCDQGPLPPKRGKLSGKVTLNGRPLANGAILFMAIDPNGINVRATVKDGQYELAAPEGPTKGKYRVEFSAPSATKVRVPNDDAPGQFMEVAPETLPPRYNRASQITVDYDPDRNQPHDFQLTTP
jgi:hypothetical protein